MQERLVVGSGGGPLSVRPMIATGAYYATQGFSKAASRAVKAFEIAAVVAPNTCQHVPAVGETEREELKIERRWEEKQGKRRARKKNSKWGNI